jgi:polyhydroxyalkanoate synthesis repressor PhaR
MIRLIKRYGGGSRKLYDTEESRYVSLDEIAAWIRDGQELQVADSATGEDVTGQTLAQIIYEDHRRGNVFLPSEFLHAVIRRGGRVIADGVEQVQTRVDRLVKASVERITPVSGMQDELDLLRDRLAELEQSLGELELETPVRTPRRKRSIAPSGRSWPATLEDLMAAKKNFKKTQTIPMLKESAHDIWLAGLGAFALAGAEGSRLFKQLVKKGEGMESVNKARINRLSTRAAELRGEARSAVLRVAAPIESGVTNAMHRLGVPTRKEIATLTRRVEELTRVVAKSKTRARKPRRTSRAS